MPSPTVWRAAAPGVHHGEPGEAAGVAGVDDEQVGRRPVTRELGVEPSVAAGRRSSGRGWRSESAARPPPLVRSIVPALVTLRPRGRFLNGRMRVRCRPRRSTVLVGVDEEHAGRRCRGSPRVSVPSKVSSEPLVSWKSSQLLVAPDAGAGGVRARAADRRRCLRRCARPGASSVGRQAAEARRGRRPRPCRRRCRGSCRRSRAAGPRRRRWRAAV